jgi:hypothetical protein
MRKILTTFSLAASLGVLVLSGTSVQAAVPCPPSLGFEVNSNPVTEANLFCSNPVVPGGTNSQAAVKYDPPSLITGVGSYKYSITSFGNNFNQVGLSYTLAGFGPASVTKNIYTDAAFSSLIGSITVNQPGSVPPPLIIADSYSQLYIEDVYNVGPGSGLTDVVNTFQASSSVPGPLPILGTAAAFGSLRKLRKLSSALKQN